LQHRNEESCKTRVYSTVWEQSQRNTKYYNQDVYGTSLIPKSGHHHSVLGRCITWPTFLHQLIVLILCTYTHTGACLSDTGMAQSASDWLHVGGPGLDSRQRSPCWWISARIPAEELRVGRPGFHSQQRSQVLYQGPTTSSGVTCWCTGVQLPVEESRGFFSWCGVRLSPLGT
jgi:hypothetical protein